jgi:hypothetical protein
MDLVSNLFLDTLLHPLTLVTAAVVTVLLMSGLLAHLVELCTDWG